MKHVIIGTAGHVDHGKTWLTRALTGTNTDRLKEEQERGITIDIGFAQLELPGGQTASIIDVPGHEGLVRNMIVGATGMDLVLMVVAADEGFMPQTQEHLDILGLLGVSTAVIVLTKIDSVDGEWADMVEADVLERVKGTFLEGAPVVRVSAATGEGIEGLRQLIARLVEDSVPKNAEHAYRLPVDRSFSVKGFGTVVTGSLVDGTLHVGDVLRVYPGTRETRVRGLQNHGEAAREMSAGMRVAANLADVERSDVSRGCVVAEPGSLRVSKSVTGLLRLIPSAPFAVRNSSRLHFFQGTQGLVCRVRLLDADELLPGEEGLAQFFFDEDVAARCQDRFVVRFFSPVVTVGGGTILDMGQPRLRRRDEKIEARLRELASTPERRVSQRIADAGLSAVRKRVLMLTENLSAAELEDALAPLFSSGEVIRVGEGLVSAKEMERLGEAARELLGSYHKAHTLERGMRLSELRESLLSEASGDADAFLALLAKDGAVCQGQGVVWLPGFEPRFSPEQEALRTRMRDLFAQAGYEAVDNEKAHAGLAVSKALFREVFARMQQDGELVALTPALTLSGDAYRRALDVFMGMFQDSDEVTLACFRDRLQVSRKYAQVILDSFDRAGISCLVGDHRVLLAGAERVRGQREDQP